MKTKIEQAKVITMAGEVLEQADILFDETGILEIGTVTGTADRVIDGRGKTVLPGFIDCHTHPSALCSTDELTVGYKNYHGVMDLLKSGITTTRITGTKYNADVVLRDMINSGELDGPRILACGEPICITCGHCAEIGMECDSVSETLKAARTLCRHHVDWLKMMPTSGVLGVGPSTEVQLSKEQIEAIIQVGHAFATPTCAHLMNYDALKLCVEAGLTCVEHGYDMDSAIAKEMVKRGTWYIPTAVVTLMEMTFIKNNDELVTKAAAAQKKVREAVKTAIQEGVKMAVGTDTGCPYTGPDTCAFATELYIYSVSGMSAMEALECATIHGAELLGIDQVTGSLEKGKQADLILVDGDPLADIRGAKYVTHTFRKGKLLYNNPWAKADYADFHVTDYVTV